MSDMVRFRTLPTSNAELRVDREARVINGVAVIELGEAKGHGLGIDKTTLQQTADLINKAGTLGLKSRFTHPGMCADGMGKMLGRVRNARVLGSQVVADLHFAKAASNGPDGDLAGHVMDLAEEDPTSCGLSIVFSGVPAWVMSDGTETPTRRKNAAGGTESVPRPHNSVGEMPFARVAKLTAADVVDEPAATSGLLAAAFSATSGENAEAAFDQLDEIRASFGLSVEGVLQFATRYCAARGFSQTPPIPEHKHMTPEQLKAFAAKHKGHEALILDNSDKTEDQLSAIIGATQLSALSAKVTELEGKLSSQATAHTAALSAKETEVADLKARLGLKAGTVNDPGSAPAGQGNAVETAWAAMSDADQNKYFHNIDVFRDAERLKAAELTAGKKD
jgi:hypothetical protein